MEELGRYAAWRELRLGPDLLRFALTTPKLVGVPHGSGRPVFLVPGLGATDRSMGPLRCYLRSIGHEATAAGLRRMTPEIDGQVASLLPAVREAVERSGGPVSFVGWSIGGVVSRELARTHPDLVHRIVTLGSPAAVGPRYTTAATLLAETIEAIRQRIAERERRPIKTPITAIWSRNDGIVSPPSARDNTSQRVEHIEVTSTHLGLGFDPEVWAITAERLAR